MKNISLEHLEKYRNNFFSELESLSDEQLNKNMDNNWSINQHLYHVWLAETSTEKYIRKKTKYPDFIKKISPLVYFNTLALRFFLKLGMKVKAPIATTTFPKKINLKDLEKNWAISRKSFKKLIEDLKNKNLDHKAVFRHPSMGRINLKLTLYFFNFHFKHHKKAINYLKKQ
jgi:hypothetical protein